MHTHLHTVDVQGILALAVILRFYLFRSQNRDK